MRLSSVLSNENKPYGEVESFIDNTKYTSVIEDVEGDLKLISNGDFIELKIGKIMMPFYSENCNDTIMFESSRNLHCLIINPLLISIDCQLTCSDYNVEDEKCCNCIPHIEKWYLVEADEDKDIFSNTPKVKVIKENHRLPNHIKMPVEIDDKYSEWFSKADIAYKERLGAGAVIYLRAIFENLTVEVGEEAGDEVAQLIYKANGNLKPFEQVLQKVDEHCAIIPNQYSENGYELFRKLSNIAHGNETEKVAIEQYESLKRLVKSVMENVERNKKLIKDNKEIKEALETVGIDIDGGAISG